ncbi:MAG: hypothetical protein K6C37_06700 [Bacteroidales bacterium]|nr:hypothetical protein [Bacteroidales bacterium]
MSTKVTKQEYLATISRLFELGAALGGDRQAVINDVIAISAPAGKTMIRKSIGGQQHA